MLQKRGGYSLDQTGGMKRGDVVWIKKVRYFLIQTAKMSHISGKTELFRSFNQKMTLFFDSNHIIQESHNEEGPE